MIKRLRGRLRLVIGTVFATLLLLGVGLFLIAWIGAYSVAASRGHWAIMEWLLTFGMRNSVELHAHLVEKPPPLDNADLSTLGAGHFHFGCAYCHGAPGFPINPIAERMLPPPPDLSTTSAQWNDQQLFWIVKNGIKYTGMPAWTSQQRDDEVWAVVSFLKRLPGLDAQAYSALALGDVTIAPQSGRELAVSEAAPEATTACARCHGAEQHGPTSQLVPILHGQPREFLLNSLQDYAAGKRESGIMQPLASDLSARNMARLADYYSRLSPPPSPAPEPAGIEEARRLAVEGRPDARIPACIGCHGPNALPTYPRLAGQNAAYMAGRLRLWRKGFATHTETDAIMAPIARQLSEEDIEAVASYFASLPVERASGAQR
jgi:cytochrome c553